MKTLIFLFIFICFGFFAFRRLLRYLHMLQQDDYNNVRFLSWLWRTRAFDKKLSLGLLALTILELIFRFAPSIYGLLLATLFFGFAIREPDPRLGAKKNLVMTQRAWRIFGVAFAFSLLAIGMAAFRGGIIEYILVVQLLPFVLPAANWFLKPVEKNIQETFWRAAEKRLKKINPTVIGITGSFGKTSVKHILGHILELSARTYYTPGSINTPMGIARVIREKLPADCRFFLVEMGAYGPGSIERLCRLTPPDFGVITAIGEAHYERYRSLDAVAHAKFELAEAIRRKPQGIVVLHEDVLQQEYADAFVEQTPERFLICGSSPKAQVKIGMIESSAFGLSVETTWGDRNWRLEAPLHGEQHAGNIVLAFATAVTLGVDATRAIAALRTVPQIKHRLEVKPQPDGTIYVDDAFNSNPRGFTAAIRLLTRLSAQQGGRRILVTPGVAELGERNDIVHAELGREAAAHVDVVIVVRSDRIPAFAFAYQAAGGKELFRVDDLAMAQEWLKKNAKPKDIILFENDLPDVLERRLSL